jgi:survival-of-motor-neuron-related-splicing factor 30
MSALADLEQQLRESEDDLRSCEEALAEDPEDATVLELVEALVTQIAQLKRDIAAASSSAPPPPTTQHHQRTKPAADDSTPPPPPPPPPAHNSLDEPPPPPAETATISFNVGDVVLAKFSQDKQYYQAKVIGKTGSSADPVYYVHFIGYPDKENKRSHEVRPVENKKRKNDGTPAAATPPARVPSVPVQNGAVITAPPSLEPPQPAQSGQRWTNENGARAEEAKAEQEVGKGGKQLAELPKDRTEEPNLGTEQTTAQQGQHVPYIRSAKCQG